ncbi:hypothetical protein ACHMW6_18385 [Pseudoduganella sp. UC29_106]
MRRQTTSWFQGWKITLRCSQFNCHDGRIRFASTVLLKTLSPPSDGSGPYWPDKIRRTIIFPENAFDTREEANNDAAAKGQRQVLALNEAPDCCESKSMGSPRDTLARQDSDENLAARFEISFDGKRYVFRQYQYELFRDALRYAVVEYGKDGFVRDLSFRPSWQVAFHPTDDDETIMKRHGIVYVEGHYLYGGYRYDQLFDAIAFAAGHPNL